ncbi:MAG TPA: hypothetical protein VNZ58_01430 [Thermomicrobiales bacterium]|nr:hypothetical protein [Thermomicrobiales bacterium]
MAVPYDSTSTQQTQRALRALDIERKRDSSEKISGWAFIWTLFAFKMATVGMIWYAAKGAPDAAGYLTVTTWYWFSIPVIAISGFIGYRLRLRSVRKRADALRRAEFDENAIRREPWVLTEDEIRKLMALEARHHGAGPSPEG